MNKYRTLRPEEKTSMSSAMLSDVLDEMGYQNQMLPLELKPNYLEARVYGRARTMKLKALEKGDDYRDVYRGLPFIEQMKQGEVLVVANGFPNFAFFGELMSTLAQRIGVEGAIVDGCTRDYVETVAMRFPVFSRTNYARDIKKRGVIETVDCPVNVGSLSIEPGDLLFGDYDGVVVIPGEIEEKVIMECMKVSTLENQIKEDLKRGVPVSEILRSRGEF